MNILNSILEKIIPGAFAQTGGAASAAPSMGRPSPLLPEDAKTEQGTQTGSGVDIDEVLRGMEAKKGMRLDWRHSIVDLMKTLDMDSSLKSRQQLAKELNYTGDVSDSAAMNIWLHEQVMQKLEANGGRLPGDLKH